MKPTNTTPSVGSRRMEAKDSDEDPEISFCLAEKMRNLDFVALMCSLFCRHQVTMFAALWLSLHINESRFLYEEKIVVS